jgi:DNA-binding PucR family transcriptional regulator
MHGPELIPVILAALFAGSTVLILARAVARRIEGRAHPSTASFSPEVSDRMERMERAVESIAIEVERVSESQRFLTKLLADRERTALPASGRGVQQ